MSGIEKEKYTAAVIGCGRIGFTLGFDKKREQPASHTMALKANKRINLAAGCDTNQDNLEKWHKYVKNAEIFSNPVKMLSQVKPDLVTVAVNEDAHLSCALEAIQAKPSLVILEKPVALNLEEGQKIVEAAKNYKVPVMVNHERRFAFDYQAAREYLPKIGEIQSIRGSLFSGLRVYSEADETSGAYSLLHDGTHLFDIVLFFLQSLENCGKEKKLLQNPVLSGLSYDKEKPDVVRNVSINYSTEKCASVSFDISGRSRFFGFEIDILGTLGRIQIGNGFMRFYQRKESKLYTGFYSLTREKSVKVPKKTGYFANMVQNAVDFLDGKKELGSTLQDGMQVLEIIEEIRNLLKKELKKRG